MNLRFKKGIISLVLAFMFTCLSACSFTGYKGEFPELYSVAVHSLLGVLGYHSHGDATIKLIEEDSFGRKMYSYLEGGPYSLLICQKADEIYAYYYPDYNFISKDWEGEKTSFSDDEIKYLKDINDWGKELNDGRCVKVKIERKKTEPETKLAKSDFETLFRKVANSKGYKGTDTIFRSSTYCTTDIFGRTLYYAWGVGRDVNGEGISPKSLEMHFKLALIFNADGSYSEETCIMEITNLMLNYQDELKMFKVLNTWNMPL